jgi:hypothetical protein
MLRTRTRANYQNFDNKPGPVILAGFSRKVVFAERWGIGASQFAFREEREHRIRQPFAGRRVLDGSLPMAPCRKRKYDDWDASGDNAKNLHKDEVV